MLMGCLCSYLRPHSLGCEGCYLLLHSLFIYGLRLVIGRFMSWSFSLVSFLFFYYDSLFVFFKQSHFATPIRPYCSTVIDFDISCISCLLVINGSVTFPSVCGHSFFSRDLWGVRSSFSSPSGSSVMVSPCYSAFDFPHPACAASSTASSYAASAFCAINSHSAATFSTSFVAVSLPHFWARTAKTSYGPCYLLRNRDKGYAARFSAASLHRTRIRLSPQATCASRRMRRPVLRCSRKSASRSRRFQCGVYRAITASSRLRGIHIAYIASILAWAFGRAQRQLMAVCLTLGLHAHQTHSPCLCAPWYRSSLWM
ncbi:hypothetical protein EDB85DRAFT_1460259 [Lactarius pseudohatsudake]|nr:hypothetical protein EDB85DRAFT_1460259 [Lactarius pseudohatsudake]